MDYVRTRSDISKNIRYLRNCLDKSGADREFAEARIALGICFVIDWVNGETVFAPSRFVGYRDNTRHSHSKNSSKDGRNTNNVLKKLFQDPPKLNRFLTREYVSFCAKHEIPLGDPAFGGKRKFWDIRNR